jgi:hypothetical protein
MSELTHPDLINRDYIRLLQVMRRLVMDEFKVSIRMTQEDALVQLMHYAADSQNNALKEMAKELEELTQRTSVPVAEETKAPEEEHTRYYRGAAIADDKPVAKSAETDKPKEKTRATRVYRGRVIND